MTASCSRGELAPTASEPAKGHLAWLTCRPSETADSVTSANRRTQESNKTSSFIARHVRLSCRRTYLVAALTHSPARLRTLSNTCTCVMRLQRPRRTINHFKKLRKPMRLCCIPMLIARVELGPSLTVSARRRQSV